MVLMDPPLWHALLQRRRWRWDPRCGSTCSGSWVTLRCTCCCCPLPAPFRTLSAFRASPPALATARRSTDVGHRRILSVIVWAHHTFTSGIVGRRPVASCTAPCSSRCRWRCCSSAGSPRCGAVDDLQTPMLFRHRLHRAVRLGHWPGAGRRRRRPAVPQRPTSWWRTSTTLYPTTAPGLDGRHLLAAGRGQI